MKGVLIPINPTERARASYRSLQCTSCHALGDDYGLRYRLFAGPDMVLFHALADALAGGSSPLGRRACVVAPGVSRLPVHQPTQRTAVAVAFGIWMGVEKLRDDVADEGGWLRALVARAFSSGHARARATLTDAGFPVQAIEQALERQRAVEAAPTATGLEQALEPTRTIAGLAFGALGTDDVGAALARDIGQRVGSILFWVDNALDLPGDLRAGRYNALAQARSLGADTPWEPLLAARAQAVAAARAELAAIAPLLVLLPGRRAAELVHSTLELGLGSQIDALEALPTARWATASTADIQPRRATVGHLYERALPRARARAGSLAARWWWRLTWRPRMAVSLLGMTLFPRAAWPNEWWPADAPMDTAMPVDTALPLPEDTGGVVDDVPADFGDRSGGCSDWLCNPCLASCGYVDCDPGRGCENACDACCSDVCADSGPTCDTNCDPNCS